MIRRLLRLTRPYHPLLLFSALLGFLTVASSIGLLATSAYIIASAALQPSIAELQVAIVGVRFFGLARGGLRYLERLVSHQTTFRWLAALRTWVYAKLEPLAPAGLVQVHSGDLLNSLIGDVETLEQFFLRVLMPALVALLSSILSWVLVARYDTRLAWMLTIFLLGAGLAVPFVGVRISRREARRQATLRASLKSDLIDTVQGLGDLLSLNAMNEHLDHVRAGSSNLLLFGRRLAWLDAGQQALSILLSHLAMLCILILAIPMVRSGSISGVDLAVLLMLTLASFEAFLPLASSLQSLQKSRVAAAHLFRIIDQPPEILDPIRPTSVPSKYDLQITNLTFRYQDGDGPALQGVSLRINQGEHVALIGPSGAGKSTLLNLLLRFWDLQEGRITLGGKEIRTFQQAALREKFGVITQRTHLFHGTVRDNLLLAQPDATQEQLLHAVHDAGLSEMIEGHPQALDRLIGEGGWLLSAGERQRIAIARALLQDAPILLLDEPTANLDPLIERAFLDAVPTLLHGRTVLWITHRLAGLERMHQIHVLCDGRIVESGTHAELTQEKGLYWRMRDLQIQARVLDQPGLL